MAKGRVVVFESYWLARDFFMQSSASKKLHHVRNSFPSLYSLLILQKGLWKKPWRTSSRFVWFSEVLRFKATLRGDALLFWYASWSHTKSHLVTLTAIPITHRKWSGQKEYFTQNPKGRIWDLNRLRYFSDDAVFWLLHNYSRTFQITYLLCTNLVQNTKYALLMNLPDICWLILR